MSLKKAGENNPLYGKLIVRILNSWWDKKL
jgi:hypothetical protein